MRIFETNDHGFINIDDIQSVTISIEDTKGIMRVVFMSNVNYFLFESDIDHCKSVYKDLIEAISKNKK